MDFGEGRPARLSLGSLFQRTLASAYNRTNKGLSTLATKLVLVGMEHTPDVSLIDPSIYNPVLCQPKRSHDSDSSADSEESGIETCTDDGVCFSDEETFIIHSGEASPLNDSQIVLSLLQTYDQLLTPEDVSDDKQGGVLSSPYKRNHMNASLVYSSDIKSPLASPARVAYRAKFVIPDDSDSLNNSESNDTPKLSKSRRALSDISNTIDTPEKTEKRRNVKNRKIGRSKSLHEKKHSRNSTLIRRHSFNGIERKSVEQDPWNTTTGGISIACRNVTSLNPIEPPTPWKLHPSKVKEQPETHSLRVHIDDSLMSRYAECSTMSFYGHSGVFLGSVLEEDESDAALLDDEGPTPTTKGSPTGSVDSGRGSPDSNACTVYGQQDSDIQDAVVLTNENVFYDVYDSFVVIHTELNEGNNVSIHEEIKVFESSISGLAGLDDSDIKIPDIFVLDFPCTPKKESTKEVYTSTPTKQQQPLGHAQNQTPDSDLEYVSALGSVGSSRSNNSSSSPLNCAPSQSMLMSDNESRSTPSQYMTATSRISDANRSCDAVNSPEIQVFSPSDNQEQSGHSLFSPDMMSDLFASIRDEESMDVDNTHSLAKTPQFAGNCTGSFSVGELKNPPTCYPKVSLPMPATSEDSPKPDEQTPVVTRQTLDRIVFNNVGEDSISELETGDIAYWMDIKNNNPTICSVSTDATMKTMNSLASKTTVNDNGSHQNDLHQLEAMLGALEIDGGEDNQSLETSVSTLVPIRCVSPDITDSILAEHISDQSAQDTWDADRMEGFMAASGSDVKELGIFSPVCHVFLAESSPLNSPLKKAVPPSPWVVVDTPLPQYRSVKAEITGCQQDTSNSISPMEISDNSSIVVNKENKAPQSLEHCPPSLEALAFNVVMNEGIATAGAGEHGELCVKAELEKLPDIKEYTEDFFDQIERTPSSVTVQPCHANLLDDNPSSDMVDMASMSANCNNGHRDSDSDVNPNSVSEPNVLCKKTDTIVTPSPGRLENISLQTSPISPPGISLVESPSAVEHSDNANSKLHTSITTDMCSVQTTQLTTLNGDIVMERAAKVDPETIEPTMFKSEMVVILNTQLAIPMNSMNGRNESLMSSTNEKSSNSIAVACSPDGDEDNLEPPCIETTVSGEHIEPLDVCDIRRESPPSAPEVVQHSMQHDSDVSDASMLTTITDVTEPSSSWGSSPDQSLLQSHTSKLSMQDDISMDMLPVIVQTVHHISSTEDSVCDNQTPLSTPHDAANSLQESGDADTVLAGLNPLPVDSSLSSESTNHGENPSSIPEVEDTNTEESLPAIEHNTDTAQHLINSATTGDMACDVPRTEIDAQELELSVPFHENSAEGDDMTVSVYTAYSVSDVTFDSHDCDLHPEHEDGGATEQSSSMTTGGEGNRTDASFTTSTDDTDAAAIDTELVTDFPKTEAPLEQTQTNEIQTLHDEHVDVKGELTPQVVQENSTLTNGELVKPEDIEALSLPEPSTNSQSLLESNTNGKDGTDGIILKIDTRRASVTSDFKFIPKPDTSGSGVAKSKVSASVASLASRKSNPVKRRATKFFRSLCCFGSVAR